MKTYVLTLSKVFPATHPRKGEPTGFNPKLMAALNNLPCYLKKLHTIRANYPLWAKRITEVRLGEAVLSVRQWLGASYRSKQITIATLTAEDGVGLQQLTDLDTNAYGFYPCVRVDKRNIDKLLVAQNDGLSLEDWLSWFKNYDLSKPLAIIHFTNFRY